MKKRELEALIDKLDERVAALEDLIDALLEDEPEDEDFGEDE